MVCKLYIRYFFWNYRCHVSFCFHFFYSDIVITCIIFIIGQFLQWIVNKMHPNCSIINTSSHVTTYSRWWCKAMVLQKLHLDPSMNKKTLILNDSINTRGTIATRRRITLLGSTKSSYMFCYMFCCLSIHWQEKCHSVTYSYSGTFLLCLY